MGGSPELAYLTSLRDPSPSSTFQHSTLMGQDPSGCVERSSGCRVCRHLVTGAHHPAWRSGIAGERTGVAQCQRLLALGEGSSRPSKPSYPTWHLTGVCTAGWSFRDGPACSDLHVSSVPGTPWTSKQPLLSHGADSACGQGHPLLFSWVSTVPPSGSSMCPSAPTLQSHRGSGAPCGWRPPCVGTWKVR